MKNYTEMSDFEINGIISMHMNGFSWVEFVDGDDRHVKCGNDWSPGFYVVAVIDYCNNWADAGPVMLENKIGIETTSLSCEWMARTCSTNMSNMMFRCSKHKNPLRAAMIVFLMMKDAEK